MIVFDLDCDRGHRFEGWFASSDAFAEQSGRGLLACPQCGSQAVIKAPMAPSVPTKANTRSEDRPQSASVARGALPPEVAEAMRALAKAQSKALANSTWVGEKFAETTRAMHYGERETTAIHGQATIDQAKDLLEEGIAVAPLPFPVAPPEELN
jgi:hypothetical protein